MVSLMEYTKFILLFSQWSILSHGHQELESHPQHVGMMVRLKTKIQRNANKYIGMVSYAILILGCYFH